MSERLPATTARPAGDRSPAIGAGRAPASANWPLSIGSIIVALFLLAGIFGPTIAPRDPLATTPVAQITGGWLPPPYPPFTVPGFPLGSDGYGRDTLSRLLWAVRPTLILVAVVAGVRLALGVVLGMIAGWSNGPLGRAVEGIMAGALAVPVLVTALAAIAAIGVDHGLLPFIAGLAITGWADTGRLVQEQTRAIRNQPFIEAAQALGAADVRIVFSHVLRQVTPMFGMLLAFEISSTLMIVAALGFLGYYIGGGVWIEVQDFLAERAAGMPELGQMLATNWEILRPWTTVIIGTVIFIAILGFNLLGEGLRRRLSLERMGRRTVPGRLAGRSRLADKLFPAGWGGLPEGVSQVASAAVLVIIVGGGVLWWQAQAGAGGFRRSDDPGTPIEVPGGHLWSGDRHDAQGTLGSQAPGLANAQLTWRFEDPAGFGGGPAVAADGTVYIGSRGETLYAISPDGAMRWQMPLPTSAVGSPALGADGTIYVADKAGGVAAYTAGGGYLWRAQSPERGSATSGPIVGPDGTIYYAVGNFVQAVSPDGEPLWHSEALSGYFEFPPMLDPGGEYIYFRNAAFLASDGSRVDLTIVPDRRDEFTDPAYVIGADGRRYFRAGHNIIHWRLNGSAAEALEDAGWNYRAYTPYLPGDAGVTPNQSAWLLYGSLYEDTRVVWINMGGSILAHAHYPQRQSRVIAVDAASTTYVCGNIGAGVRCLAFEAGSDQPLWTLNLERGGKVVGGAQVPGRLYVATEDGLLYAAGGSAAE